MKFYKLKSKKCPFNYYIHFSTTGKIWEEEEINENQEMLCNNKF